MKRRLVLVALLASACEGQSVVVLEGTKSAPIDASCLPSGDINLCASIPPFSAAQIVDGRPDEFCGVRPMVFRVDEAPWKRGAGTYPQTAKILAAWSATAMHIHVHVSDPKIVIAPDGALTDGDAIEFYLAGTSDLHGPIDGVSDGGSVQIIVSPPSGAVPARAKTYFHPSKGVQTEAPYGPSQFAGRLVDDGYEIEIVMPWSHANPGRGAGIGFDVVVDVADVDAATGLELQAAIGYRFPLETNCTADVGPQPFCDNKTWCTPRLE